MALSFSASISSSAGSRPHGIWGGDDGHMEVELCDCGVAARPRKSMTEGNPSRHFYGCAHYGRALSQKPCNYFRWIEPPHRDEVLHKLMRKVQSLEDMTRRQSVKEWKLKVMLCGSWCFFFIVMIVSHWYKPIHHGVLFLA